MQIIGTKIFSTSSKLEFVPKACVFCGINATLTNAHVLSQPIRAVFNDPSVTGSFVYRQSSQADGSHAAHSHSGSWVDVKARAECSRCNAGWTRQIEESVSTFLPELIKGHQVQLSVRDQQALASWSVVTVLLLQHTHSRVARLVIPASDYADVYETKSPTALMKVFTGYLEPPGRGSRAEVSAEYLAEDRSMAGISRLLESDGVPPPLDMRAYTATLRLGFWVAHVLRVGSSQFIERVSPAGPALSPCLLTIWPTQSPLVWPPRSLATIGGLMGLARSIDNTGIGIV
jgi:hypothetical protein